MLAQFSKRIVRRKAPHGGLKAMQRWFHFQSAKAGMPPGSLVSPPEPPAAKPILQVCNYGPGAVHEQAFESVGEAVAAVDESQFTWMNIDHALDVGLVEQIGGAFDVDPLILEDIMNSEHRPKAEDRGGFIYVALQHLAYDEVSDEVSGTQVGILILPGTLITMNERPIERFEGVRDRIRRRGPRLTTLGPIYLAYALMDVLVDNYFHVLELLGERIASVEQALAGGSLSTDLRVIHHLQNELIFAHRWIWPVRELVAELQRSESPIVMPEVRPFLRDLHDHIVEVNEAFQTYREMVANLLNVYHSVLSSDTNAAMRVLTIVATIFIPLTFIAGLYGMNFKFMPELGWTYGYPVLLGVMFFIAVGMLWVFRKRRWL